GCFRGAGRYRHPRKRKPTLTREVLQAAVSSRRCLSINVKFLECPAIVVSSLVRVDRLDGVLNSLRRSLYYSCKRGFVFRGAVVERKGDAFDRNAGAVLAGPMELPSSMIECTSQVVPSVPGNPSNVGGNVSCARQGEAFLSRLRIVLGTDTMRLGMVDGVDHEVQVVEVLLGPFAFEPSAV